MPTNPPQFQLTKAEIQLLAKMIVAELFRLLTQEENVEKAAKAWGGYLDRWIGGGFRKVVMYVLIAVSGAMALKFQIWTLFLKD